MFLVYCLLTISEAVAVVPVVSVYDVERFQEGVVYEEVDCYDGSKYWSERSAIYAWRKDAYAHWEFCKQQLDLRMSPWIDWGTLEREAFFTSEAWRFLDDARSNTWNPAWKLMDLGELRRTIGVEAYMAGRMPVPQTWTKGFIP